MKMESIEHARFRALAQILVNKEKGAEAFEEYMKLAFPYLEASKRRTNAEAIKILEQEIKRGPIAVKPQTPTHLKSKIRNRIEQAKPHTKEASRIYDKMGRSMPL